MLACALTCAAAYASANAPGASAGGALGAASEGVMATEGGAGPAPSAGNGVPASAIAGSGDRPPKAGATPAAPAAAPLCPPAVRVSFPNFEIASLVLGTDRIESPPGQLVEWTRRAIADTGCKSTVSMVRRPPNRQLAEMDLGLLDILPGFAFSADLATRLAFPMRGDGADTTLAVMRDTVSLYVRAAEKRISWNGSVLAGATQVGTSTGGAAADTVIREHGWTREMAPTPYADMQKLIAARIDVIIEPDVIMARYLRGAGAGQVRKLTPPALVTDRYAPVRAGFQQQYPEFTRRFWHALCMQSRADYPALGDCR